jgi:TRAP-type transport system small permease protein
VAKNNHIQVDLLYRWLPKVVSRTMAVVVDVLRIAFLGAMTYFTVLMMQKMGNYKMTIIDLPMNIVYGVCALGFAAMTVRALWVAKVHWRRGYTVLERPESTMLDR